MFEPVDIPDTPYSAAELRSTAKDEALKPDERRPVIFQFRLACAEYCFEPVSRTASPGLVARFMFAIVAGPITGFCRAAFADVSDPVTLIPNCSRREII